MLTKAQARSRSAADLPNKEKSPGGPGRPGLSIAPAWGDDCVGQALSSSRSTSSSANLRLCGAGAGLAGWTVGAARSAAGRVSARLRAFLANSCSL
jgi:hypothetical protein